MADLITINEAAQRLGAKPFDVIRLIDAGLIAAATLVDADSLRAHQESR